MHVKAHPTYSCLILVHCLGGIYRMYSTNTIKTETSIDYSTSDPGAQSRFPSPSKNCSRPLSIIQAILLYSVSFFKVISHYQVSESQVIGDNTVITHIQVFPLTQTLSTKGPSALICLQRYTCQDRSIHFVGQCTYVKAVAKLCPIITRYIRWSLQCDRVGTHRISSGAIDSFEVFVIWEFSIFQVYFKEKAVISFGEGLEAPRLGKERDRQERKAENRFQHIVDHGWFQLVWSIEGKQRLYFLIFIREKQK